MEERQLFSIDAWELLENLPTEAFPNASQASVKSALPGILAVDQEMGSLDLVKFLPAHSVGSYTEWYLSSTLLCSVPAAPGAEAASRD